MRLADHLRYSFRQAGSPGGYLPVQGLFFWIPGMPTATWISKPKCHRWTSFVRSETDMTH
jgi:hypothetical protein